MTKRQLSSDLVRAENGPKRPLAKVIKGLRSRMQGALVGLAMYAAPVKAQSPAETVCEYAPQKEKDNAGPLLDNVYAKNQRESEKLAINSSVESFDCRRTANSDVIEVRFKDGKRLTIEVEPNSIQNSYVEGSYYTRQVGPDFESIVEYMRDMQVSEVTSYSCGGDDPEPKIRLKVKKNDMVAFERNDGSRLVVEFAPGAIKSITLDSSRTCRQETQLLPPERV